MEKYDARAVVDENISRLMLLDSDGLESFVSVLFSNEDCYTADLIPALRERLVDMGISEKSINLLIALVIAASVDQSQLRDAFSENGVMLFSSIGSRNKFFSFDTDSSSSIIDRELEKLLSEEKEEE